ncbi:MAG: hypothetical protein ACOX6L_10120 [Syntrophomonadaceae bacterium]|jgi:hypothetical protein
MNNAVIRAIITWTISFVTLILGFIIVFFIAVLFNIEGFILLWIGIPLITIYLTISITKKLLKEYKLGWLPFCYTVNSLIVLALYCHFHEPDTQGFIPDISSLIILPPPFILILLSIVYYFIKNKSK